MPHLQKLYDELRDRGLEIVAVNAFDSEERVRKYLQENGFTFKVVLGGSGEQYRVGRAYGVQSYPTSYLLDAQGRVVWREVGYNEAALRAALTKLGL